MDTSSEEAEQDSRDGHDDESDAEMAYERHVWMIEPLQDHDYEDDGDDADDSDDSDDEEVGHYGAPNVAIWRENDATNDASGLLILQEALPSPRFGPDDSQGNQQTLGSREQTATPALHAYLGSPRSGQLASRDYEHGTIIEIPILLLPGVLLFPGENVPLMLNGAYAALAASLFRGRTEDGTRAAQVHLGVIGCKGFSQQLDEAFANALPIGTTIEIRSRYGNADTQEQGGAITVMARGRYRFRPVEEARWRYGVRYWKVRICEDQCPGPLRPPIPPPLRRHSSLRSRVIAHPSCAVDAHCPYALIKRVRLSLQARNDVLKRRMATRRGPRGNAEGVDGGDDDRGVTASEPYTRQSREPQLQRSQRSVEREEKEEDDEKQSEYQDEDESRGGKVDPTLYSFWLAANLPLGDDARLELLKLDSVVMRLRKILDYLDSPRVGRFCCIMCRSRVAVESDIFTLTGAEGVVGAYVNPHGHVHQTITLRKANRLLLVGSPQSEHTWFPGYAWTIASCIQCNHNLGWRFTALGDTGSDPTTFYGLCRSSLILDKRGG